LLLRTPIIALLFQRGSFTAQSTALVSQVFIGLAPCVIGWTLMDLISRCCFALGRPRLPLIAAFVPVTVNCLCLEILNLRGELTDPVLLGLGASAGLIAGFIVIFLLTRSLRNRVPIPQPAA
jgi:putative peptidoglycan lipid II flippase